MSTPYHMWENGQVEVTNKVLETILTRIVQQHHKYWAKKILEAVWASITTWKKATKFTPYELLYKNLAILHIDFGIKTLRTTLQVRMDPFKV